MPRLQVEGTSGGFQGEEAKEFWRVKCPFLISTKGLMSLLGSACGKQALFC